MAKDQIRLVIRTFKERLFTEIFPGRKEVPKTLVFAKTDLHADDIVQVIRDEFGKGNEFCQKITSKTTGIKPDELLQQFRNSYHPRIAVTVDMITTGTDVKAIERLIFMRNINSASYFEQMKGRGVRVIDSTDLAARTPDAHAKTRFVIVDAVGVCEHDKTLSKPLDREPSVPLEKLLQMVAQGIVHPDLVSTLASRLARLGHEMEATHHLQIAEAADGKKLADLVSGLLSSVDPDKTAARAAEKFGLAPGAEPDEKQLDAVERECMAEALKPFHTPKLRETILGIKASLEQVIDEVTRDRLLSAHYDATSVEKAKSLVSDFKQFVRDNKDEIEAIKLLYSKPYRAGLRYRHVRDLAMKLNRPPFAVKPDDPDSVRVLWSAHAAAEPDSIKTGGGNALVDLVALVRHAIHPKEPVIAVRNEVEENYGAWLADKEKAGIVFTAEQRQWLDAIKDHIAQSLAIEQTDFDDVPFNRMGGLGKVYQLFGDRVPTLLDELNNRLAA